jgi:hypothetical protein
MIYGVPSGEHLYAESGRCRVEVKSYKHDCGQILDMATNITFHHGTITWEERQEILGQKGLTLWLTGLSASGKVRIASGYLLRSRYLMQFGTPSRLLPVPSSNTWFILKNLRIA